MSAWPSSAIADVLAEAKSGFACGEDPSDGVFHFRMNNITADGRIDLSKKRRVPRATRNLDAFLVRPGDVLFNATNSPELVGKSAYFTGLDEPAVFSNHFLRLRPRSDRLDGRFLARWLQLQFQRGVFQGMCRQWVNQAAVGRESLLGLQLPLPPLGEQRRIADVLDRAEALRVKRRSALARDDLLTEAIFLDMFGDPAKNPKGWAVRSLHDLVRGVTNGLTRRRKEPEIGLSIVLRLRDIRSGWIDFSGVNRITLTSEEAQRYQVLPGDVLIIRVNGNPQYVGRCALFDGYSEAVAFNDHIMRVALDHTVVDGSFITFVLNGAHGKREIASYLRTSAGQHTINHSGLGRVRIPLPPLVLQAEFARRVAAVQRLRMFHQASLVELDSLFASLQQKAFQGELWPITGS